MGFVGTTRVERFVRSGAEAPWFVMITEISRRLKPHGRFSRASNSVFASAITGDRLASMGAVRKAILWNAASRHATIAHERRLRARTLGPVFPEFAAAAEAEADQWERAMIVDLRRLDEIHALPVAIDTVLRNKEYVKEVLASGTLDRTALRPLDRVSLELVVAQTRTALVEMVLLEHQTAR